MNGKRVNLMKYCQHLHTCLNKVKNSQTHRLTGKWNTFGFPPTPHWEIEYTWFPTHPPQGNGIHLMSHPPPTGKLNMFDFPSLLYSTETLLYSTILSILYSTVLYNALLHYSKLWTAMSSYALLCYALYSALLCFPPVCSPLLSSTLLYSNLL